LFAGNTTPTISSALSSSPASLSFSNDFEIGSKHREINDHPIEVVAQYFTSRKQHCKSSVLKGSDYRALTAAHSDLMENRFVKPAAMAGVLRSVLWIRTKLRYIAIAGTLSEAIRHLQVAE
jgi:hypothetical protein